MSIFISFLTSYFLLFFLYQHFSIASTTLAFTGHTLRTRALGNIWICQSESERYISLTRLCMGMDVGYSDVIYPFALRTLNRKYNASYWPRTIRELKPSSSRFKNEAYWGRLLEGEEPCHCHGFQFLSKQRAPQSVINHQHVVRPDGIGSRKYFRTAAAVPEG